jgi:hypothetical protein
VDGNETLQNYYVDRYMNRKPTMVQQGATVSQDNAALRAYVDTLPAVGNTTTAEARS